MECIILRRYYLKSMAVKIRLTRMGAKSKPFYRIVATDTDSPRDGKHRELRADEPSAKASREGLNRKGKA